MLTKLTSKNQLTIPKKLLSQFPPVEYFDVEVRDGLIVLKPVEVLDSNLDQIRAKIKKLGLSDTTIAEAVKWAREK